MHFFACFRPYIHQADKHIGWATLMPFPSIYPTDPRTNLWNFREKILRMDGFENSVFLRWPFWFINFFLLHPIKSSQSFFARMGQNFDDYPGFQPMSFGPTLMHRTVWHTLTLTAQSTPKQKGASFIWVFRVPTWNILITLSVPIRRYFKSQLGLLLKGNYEHTFHEQFPLSLKTHCLRQITPTLSA